MVDLDKKKFVKKVMCPSVQQNGLLDDSLLCSQIGDETLILPSKLFQYLEHTLVCVECTILLCVEKRVLQYYVIY